MTDLTADDFLVSEDGHAQVISFFSADNAAALSASGPSQPGQTATGREPRTFFIVLGRGRLDAPSLKSLVAFVRALPPQDVLGIAAYDRFSGVSADHDGVARFLSTYAAAHPIIEARLSNQLSGLAARFWNGQVPPAIQRDIDTLFASTPWMSMRVLPLLVAPDEQQYRRVVTELDEFERENDAAAAVAVKGRQDIDRLFTSVELLRHMPGEKHLLYVADQFPEPTGYTQPRLERLAQLAADARVTVSTLHVGGLWAPEWASAKPGANVLNGRPMSALFALNDIRDVATQTGGQMFAYRYADQALLRYGQVVSSYYVLAYYPTDGAPDGRFHRIEVKVRRPGVTLHFRRGYYGVPSPRAGGERASQSRERVSAALRDLRVMPDIPVELSATRDGRVLTVVLRVKPSAVRFDAVAGRHVAQLEVGIAAGWDGKPPIGEQREAVDLSFDSETFATLGRDGIRHTISLTLSAAPGGAHVKAVVYDYRADRVGSAVQAIR